MVNVEDIIVEARLRSSLRKIEIWLLKFIPITISILYLINAILGYFNLSNDIPSAFGGVSLLVWIYLYISSWVNGFCIYHRMFLYFIFVEEILCWYDYKIGVPINDRNILITHIVLFITTLIIVVYLKFKVCKKQ